MPISAQLATSLSFRIETCDEFFPDLDRVIERHWRELGLFQEHIKIAYDKVAYRQIEALGQLLIIAARNQKQLVGYIISFIRSHLHYKDAGLMAYTDMYYILPEFRNGAGLTLFALWENELRKRGVVEAITSCKVHSDNTEFLQKLGWEFTDKTFCKYMGAKCQP